MKKRNVTIVIDEDLFLRARVWAAQRNQSLSTVVRVLLETVHTMPRAAQRFPIPGQPPAAQPPANAPAPPAPASPPPTETQNPL